MRQTHVAGERMFVDYPGTMMEVIDASIGDVKTAQLFEREPLARPRREPQQTRGRDAMPNPAPEWPPAQIEAVRTMAEQGQPASVIARALTAEFGIARSRSAVIGKLFRLREAATEVIKAAGTAAKTEGRTGVRYGKYLVAVEEVPTAGRGQLWRFRCDCGEESVKRASNVKCGRVASCGHCGLRGRHPRRRAAIDRRQPRRGGAVPEPDDTIDTIHTIDDIFIRLAESQPLRQWC
jgi:hypothetical protein